MAGAGPPGEASTHLGAPGSGTDCEDPRYYPVTLWDGVASQWS